MATALGVAMDRRQQMAAGEAIASADQLEPRVLLEGVIGASLR